MVADILLDIKILRARVTGGEALQFVGQMTGVLVKLQDRFREKGSVVGDGRELGCVMKT